MAKQSLKRMIVEEISQMTSIDGTATRINSHFPKKVWILLGEVGDSSDQWSGHCEVVAVFKHNPTEKQKKEALKRHIFRCFGVKNAKDLEEKQGVNLVAEMARYGVGTDADIAICQDGCLHVATGDIEP